MAAYAHLHALGDTPLLQTLMVTLKASAKRWLMLAVEMKDLDATLDRLTATFALRLRKQFCVGPQTAATLIAIVGDNPERRRRIVVSRTVRYEPPLRVVWQNHTP